MGFNYRRFGRCGPVLEANASALDKSFSQGFRPPPRVDIADWAARYRRFGDDAPISGPWRNETAPYLVEIMNRLAPHDPCHTVAIKKCSQSGGSAAGENMIGYVADVAPGPMLYVQATLPAAKAWARQKLWAMINASPQLRGLIKDSSVALQLDFRKGGYLVLAGANSAPSLAQMTIRYAIEDDLDQWPDDLDGQGSPEAMVESRLKVNKRLGQSKRLKIGTPTVKGASKIDAAFLAGDQRRFYFRCPACASRFLPVWEVGENAVRDIHWPEGRAEEAYLVAPCCGVIVEHWQKIGMILVDGWVPTVEIEGVRPPRHMAEDEFQRWRARDVGGLQPSYHIPGILTVFDSWGELARKFAACGGDLNKLKGWVMLDNGDVYEVKGDAPDHDKLARLVEQEWGQGRRLPFGPCAATMGVDVQGDGTYYEILAHGPRFETWALEAGFVPGATDVEGEGAWADLDKIAKRPVVYPGGREYPIDQICVDAGYHTKAAEAFCKGFSNRLAVFGRDGWTRPILGRFDPTTYETQGKNAGKGHDPESRAYKVGTYGVKLTFYGFLRTTLKAFEDALAGAAIEIRGRCHFGAGLPNDYFEQITAETIETSIGKNGYPRRVWKPIKHRPNHYLDCRVYNHAAAERIKLETLTPDEWAAIAAERWAAPDRPQADLFDQPMKPTTQAPAAPTDANAVRTDGAWISAPAKDWL